MSAVKQQSAEELNKGFSLAFDKMAVKTILTATVVSVNGYSTCEVELENGLHLYDVRLNAIEAAMNSQMTARPKQGSKVLVGVIENVRTEAVVLACSEIDNVFVKIDTAEMTVSNNGFKIECQGENLKDTQNDFFDEVCKIVVMNGRSPDVAAINAIRARQNKILV